MSAVVLHVIMTMTFEGAKVTSFLLSVNEINIDHPIYEIQDIHKVFKNIKLKTFNTEKCVECMLCVWKFSKWVYPFNQIKYPTTRLYTDAFAFCGGARRGSLNVYFIGINWALQACFYLYKWPQICLIYGCLSIITFLIN